MTDTLRKRHEFIIVCQIANEIAHESDCRTIVTWNTHPTEKEYHIYFEGDDRELARSFRMCDKYSKLNSTMETRFWISVEDEYFDSRAERALWRSWND